jgi:hypothetical protein
MDKDLRDPCWSTLDKEVLGQLALLWSFLPKQTTPTAVLASIGASRSGTLLWVTETIFPNSREAIRQPVFFNETTHKGDYR